MQDEPTYSVKGQRERGEIKPPAEPPPPTPDTLRILGIQLGEMLADKNERYGSAFMRVPEMLKLYFPDGIRPDQYGDVAMFIWIFEKKARIAACPVRGDVEDPYIDIAGFGVLGSYLWPKHRTPTQTWTEGERRGPGAPSPTCRAGVPCCRIDREHWHNEDRIEYPETVAAELVAGQNR